MCGIGGFFGPWERDLLEAMNAAQRHRGPDAEGVYWEPGFGLAHVRLSILDTSDAAAQPMRSRDGRWVLSFNGEIYNFRELRAQLHDAGVSVRSSGDTEVLLAALITWGSDCLAHLNGIFALALWDGHKRELLLARDHLGVKPLYYSALSRGVVFASEIKAQLACTDIARTLDLPAVHNCLAHLWSPGAETLLQAVRKVLPGQALLVRDGRVARRWHYYDPPVAATPAGRVDRDALHAELRHTLEQAVRRQMVSDVPVGAFLSGGLDSSAVVAMMCRHMAPEALRCYSIGFDAGHGSIDGNPDDLPYARRVAGHLGVELQTLTVTPDIISDLEKLLFHLDEPQADPAPLNAMLIAEQARRHGIKVLLSGAGGDDVFSGYRRHVALRAEACWGWLPVPLRRPLGATARALLDGRAPPRLLRNTWLRRFGKAFWHADYDPDQRLAAHFLWGTETLRRALYGPALRDAVNDSPAEECLLQTLRRIPRDTDPLERMLYLERKHFLPDHNLNYTDKTAMAAGVEVRVPLIDTELVALAAKIPPRMKLRGVLAKAAFKDAMGPLLPRAVIHRPKSGFGAPLRFWLRNQLVSRVEDTLSYDSLSSRGLFDPGAVHRLIRLDREGRVDGAHTIYSLMCIELWCRLFLDRTTPGY